MEIEAKLSVPSHDPVREKLHSLSTKFIGQGLETNSIYDWPDGSLRQAGKGLRIRSVKPDSGQVPPPTLTVKGPVGQGPVVGEVFKSREEVELQIDDPQPADRMLSLLGFIRVMIYEKQRQSWLFSGCKVELDTLPLIGRFVEIEGPNEKTISHVKAQLGLAQTPHIPNSYIGLLLTYCHDHHIDPTNIAF